GGEGRWLLLGWCSGWSGSETTPSGVGGAGGGRLQAWACCGCGCGCGWGWGWEGEAGLAVRVGCGRDRRWLLGWCFGVGGLEGDAVGMGGVRWAQVWSAAAQAVAAGGLQVGLRVGW
ncbi:hypothetical protein ACLQ2O_01340, partial [Kribbella sp. DT2]